jgi:hypothetical protein
MKTPNQKAVKNAEKCENTTKKDERCVREKNRA